MKNKVFPGYVDSLPEFSTRIPGRLESILNSSQLKAELLHQDIFQVAANYYVSINRGHPFSNGNKRLSIYYADVFLRLNGYRLRIPIDHFLELSIEVNISRLDDEVTKKLIAEFFKKNSEAF